MTTGLRAQARGSQFTLFAMWFDMLAARKRGCSAAFA